MLVYNVSRDATGKIDKCNPFYDDYFANISIVLAGSLFYNEESLTRWQSGTFSESSRLQGYFI